MCSDTSSEEEQARPALTTEDRVAGKRPLATFTYADAAGREQPGTKAPSARPDHRRRR